MKTIDYSLRDYQYEGTKTFFFRISDTFMPGKFLDMYDTWLPIGVDLTCAEFHELFEVYCNYYDSGECKTADDLCGEEAIYYKLPHIREKVIAAIKEQAPKYYGEGILPVIDQFNVYFPHEFSEAHLDLEEGNECTVNDFTRITEVYIPDSVEDLSTMSFENYYSLRSVRLSENLISIPMSTFETCVGLKELIIPESVERIERFALNYCLSLEKLTIKSKHCIIANDVFTGCNSLKEIHISLTEIKDVTEIFPDNIVHNAALYVPAAKIDDYKKHRHFGLFNAIIPE